jgi:hypothetical protein
MGYRWTVVLGLLAAGAPAAVAAQARTAALRGAVSGVDGPLAGATVEVLGTKRTVLTSETGEFRFDGLTPGRYWINARRIGYGPASFTATLEADSVRQVQITLEAAPQRLKDLEVTAGMTRNRYYDFLWRSRGSFGRFLTRDDIQRSRAFDAIDLVQRYLPGRSRWALEQGNWFEPSFNPFGAGDWTPAGARLHRNNFDCAPGVSIDGASPWPGARISDYPIDEIEAIEVYRRVEWVPIEFSRNSTACGLVVIWLK